MLLKQPLNNRSSQPERAAGPKRPRWIFRFAAFLLPIVFLLVLELLLRLLGYGYSPHFFLPAKVNGANVFIENQKFSRRYFPPALARTPQPALFAAKKPANTVRVFVFGESAAMGDPEPSFGFSRILEILLQDQYPAVRVEIINVAVTAINSHVVRQIARDCASKDGDIWIIYMGNNEVVGPYGAGTVFGSQTPSLSFIRASIALKATRIGQLLDSLRQRLSKSQTPPSWEGMEMFLKQRVRQSDPRMAKVYSHFDANLQDIVNIGRRAGARIVLSTVPTNLKDCPPFASERGVRLTPAHQKEWDEAYRNGAELKEKGSFGAALEQYQKCLKLDDHYADSHYQTARCLAGLGRAEEARRQYILACDLDTLRFRADTRINEIIRAAGARYSGSGFALLGAMEVFAEASPQKLVGQELFLEHVHLNFHGNYLLARATAEQAERMLNDQSRVTPTRVKSVLSESECAERLALTDWDWLQIVEEMIRRLEQPPFTQQLDHKEMLAQWKQQREKLQSANKPEALDRAIAIYKRALELRSADWVLHENFAKLLQSTGDPTGAEKQWRAVIDLMPHSEQALYSLGNVLDAQGKSAEALTWFHRALEHQPNSYEARNGLGLALSNQGKTEDAIANYRAALRDKPDFAGARINLGQALAELGRQDEAIAEYRAALRADSNSVAGHINLGKALAKKGLSVEAQSEYEAALRLNPNDAIAHYNFGNLLAGRDQDESVRQLEEAVRVDPRFAEARFNLGLAYAARNRTVDALAQFQEVVRLRPQFAPGHLNLGVALAKTGRYPEAISQFEETLRLEPSNTDAKRFLAQAQALQNRTTQ